MSTIHATCVAIGGHGVLLVGPSGAGKSDIALRLIDRGARLVSDDYTALRVDAGRLIASAPATIAGQLEVRGVGIVAVEPLASVPIALRVEAGAPERMPEPAEWAMAGIAVPTVRLAFLEPSAPLKVEYLLAALA